MKTILVTGAAGFVRTFHVIRTLKEFQNVHLVGIDSIADYYDIKFKYERLSEIDSQRRNWRFGCIIGAKPLIDQLFADEKPSVVVSLPAQAGVHYSISTLRA